MVTLTPAMIAGYRSAIAAIHQGFPDGYMVTSNTNLSTLLKGDICSNCQTKDSQRIMVLPTVTVKRYFLLQLALARRGGQVHSFRIDSSSGHLCWENGGVLLPSLSLDKNQLASFTPS